jgi:hypothetical protein
MNYGYVMMDFVNWTCETLELWLVMMVQTLLVCLWMYISISVVVRFEFELCIILYGHI